MTFYLQDAIICYIPLLLFQRKDDPLTGKHMTEPTLPELLAPAGSLQALYAAVAGGADAVYLGGKSFSARANAKNFDGQELSRAVRYCHLHGVRVYVTVNILLTDRELPEAVAFCRTLHRLGVDAVIAADVGLLALLRREVPGLAVHASTQLSVHSTDGVRCAGRMGVLRVVPARELSGVAICRLTKTGMPIEVFLHGALCVCHSGQCLFSSLVGGRSGNRGNCAQPCRLPYEGGYRLSLRDLCLAGHIPALIRSGVRSLKIEGRMKSPAYVYGVCRIYRRLLQERRAATPEETEELRQLFSRDGFTDAYFTGDLRAPMLGVRGEERASAAVPEFPPISVPISAVFFLSAGRKCKLRFTFRDITAEVEGDVPAPAQTQALTEETVRRALCKLGDTDFTLAPAALTVQMQPGLFLPMGALNALRRAAAETLSACFARPLPPPDGTPAPTAMPPVPESPAPVAPLSHPLSRTALFYRPEAYRACHVRERFDVCFLPLHALPLTPMPNGVALPAVVTDAERPDVRERLLRARESGVRYALLGNIGQLALCLEAGLIPVADFRFNITNRSAADYWLGEGIGDFLLSPELTLPQIRDLGRGGVIAYGRIPLMVTERCFIRDGAGGCTACGRTALRDRTGARFPLLREHPHRNLIFNSLPTYMGDRQEELRQAGVRHLHLIFSVEDGGEIDRVVQAFDAGLPLPGTRRLPSRNDYRKKEDA